jgi:hypothetical protein
VKADQTSDLTQIMMSEFRTYASVRTLLHRRARAAPGLIAAGDECIRILPGELTTVP